MRIFNRRSILNGLCGSGAATAMATTWPKTGFGQQNFKEIHALKPGEFTWHPERSPLGPVAIVVSLPDQRVHVYRNGIRIAVSTCSTGKTGHDTPTGVFTILEKDKNHRSSTYNNAPMPNMNRLTWSGIALHAGNLPGYPASHGCIRLPTKFSELLFGLTHVGTPVILAGSHAQPSEIVHPGLVLGDYASSEFDKVQSGLKGKELPWAPHVTDYAAPAAILISGADRTGTLLVNGKIVGQRPVVIREPDKPLGSHVLMLQAAQNQKQGLSWHSIAHNAQAGVSFDWSDETILTRISADAEARAIVHQYMHPGMTLVTTDLPAHPNTRTGEDFVVMSTGKV